MVRSLLASRKRTSGITLRDSRELSVMREAGRIVAQTHEALRTYIRPGVTTAELDAIAKDVIYSHGATPTFLGYYGFPASICTSINDEIVHGIPNPHVILAEGDIISIDVGATHKGWVGDSGWTYPVGEISPTAQSLLDTTEGALWAGIEMARAGNRLGDISAAVQSYVESCNFSVVREFTGHGVGREMHESPEVLNYGDPGTGLRLRRGMTLALEPMVSVGHWLTKTDADGWTVRTQDGTLSAHFEHSIAVMNGEPRIFTLL